MHTPMVILSVVLLTSSQPTGEVAMGGHPQTSQPVALESSVLTPQEAADAPAMLRRDMWVRMEAANRRQTEAWEQVHTSEQWERFRDARLEALDASLGYPPSAKHDLMVTGVIEGEGFRIEKLVISGRPGLPITANLYLPDPPGERMPGIVICSSHHNPKHQGELQDMGMTWARSGAMVIVPDNLGHGERRQQPFGGREDYHWRYNLGIQLHVVGQSLIGWMVADLRRCVDVLLAREGVDPSRILSIGAVAGGGEPAAVLAAFDKRVTCSIPFNFGSGSGAQAEMPPSTQPVYNWASFGDWESTRCLRLSGRDGFFPWMIVAAAAPRPLIFGKEFAFDAASDPAFQRVRQVYEWYGAADRLDEVHGWGNVRLRPPEASHCNNVGAAHRAQIYPLLARWFGMPVPEEYQKRLEPAQLDCLTPEARTRFEVRMVHEVAADAAGLWREKARGGLDRYDAAGRRRHLRKLWAQLLGDVEPRGAASVTLRGRAQAPGATIERILLKPEPGIDVPLVLLLPAIHDERANAARRPVVIGLSQHGKTEFLSARAEEIARLLRQGVAVCLPDVRGTGETSPGPDRSYVAEVTEVSAQELKLGQTLLGSRLRDLRSVMRYLETRDDIDATRVGLWGDSFAPVNPQTFDDPPLRTETAPHQAEPLGALLAVLGALYEPNVKAVVARGGLVSYASILDAPALYVPHDAVVPFVLTAGDIRDLAAALTPTPLRLEALVDGRNRAVDQQRLDTEYAPARVAYADDADRLRLHPSMRFDADEWLAAHLAGRAPATRPATTRPAADGDGADR